MGHVNHFKAGLYMAMTCTLDKHSIYLKANVSPHCEMGSYDGQTSNDVRSLLRKTAYRVYSWAQEEKKIMGIHTLTHCHVQTFLYSAELLSGHVLITNP